MVVGKWYGSADPKLCQARMYSEGRGNSRVCIYLPEPISEADASAIIAFLRTRPSTMYGDTLFTIAHDLSALSSIEVGSASDTVVAEQWYNVWFGGRGYTVYCKDGTYHLFHSILFGRA